MVGDNKESEEPLGWNFSIIAAHDFSRTWAFLTSHPALLTTCGYLYICIIGLLSDSVLLGRFGIPLVYFLGTRDLLLAGLRNWVSLVFGIVPFVYASFGMVVIRLLESSSAERLRRYVFVSTIFVAFILIPAFVAFNVSLQAAAIVRPGGAPSYTVTLEGEKGNSANVRRELVLITTTETQLFFFDRSKSEALVVPLNRLIAFSPVRRVTQLGVRKSQ